MGLDVEFRAAKGRKVQARIGLTSTLMEIIEVLKEKNADLRERLSVLDVTGFGEAKQVTKVDVIGMCEALVSAIESDNTLTTVYLFIEESEMDRVLRMFGKVPPHEGGTGAGGMIDGVPYFLDGGLGQCILRLNPQGEYPDMTFDQEVDIRDREYVDTDNGKMFINKSKPKSLPELKEFAALREKLEDLDEEELEVIIG